MVCQEDIEYFSENGESVLLENLTSEKPHERHLAMCMIVDFERLLANGNIESMDFQKLFKENKMKYEYMEEEE